MKHLSRAAWRFGMLAWAITLAGCVTTSHNPPATIRYVGSSTVANFVSDASQVYQAANFQIDAAAESEGGATAIRERLTDLAGIARRPQEKTLLAGVQATLIGHDAIAVVVNASNPVKNLSRAQLSGVFSGRIKNWGELGGRDIAVHPFIVDEASATHGVFQKAILEPKRYAHCTAVRPDQRIISEVANDPGGIGTISFSFLRSATGVRPVAVDGQQASVINFEYPISRPLYLLSREENGAVNAFVSWAQSEEGQQVVMQRFVGTRVVGSVKADLETVEQITK